MADIVDRIAHQHRVQRQREAQARARRRRIRRWVLGFGIAVAAILLVLARRKEPSPSDLSRYDVPPAPSFAAPPSPGPVPAAAIPDTAGEGELQRFLDTITRRGITSMDSIRTSPEYGRLSPVARQRFERWLAPAQRVLDQWTEKIVSGELPRRMDEGIARDKEGEVRTAAEHGAAVLQGRATRRDRFSGNEGSICSLLQAHNSLVSATENLARTQARLGRPAIPPGDASTVEASLQEELVRMVRDGDGTRALLYAVDEGWYYCAKVLIDAGVDVRVVGPEGRTLLQIAESGGYWQIAAMLRDAGAQR